MVQKNQQTLNIEVNIMGGIEINIGSGGRDDDHDKPMGMNGMEGKPEKYGKDMIHPEDIEKMMTKLESKDMGKVIEKITGNKNGSFDDACLELAQMEQPALLGLKKLLKEKVSKEMLEMEDEAIDEDAMRMKTLEAKMKRFASQPSY